MVNNAKQVFLIAVIAVLMLSSSGVVAGPILGSITITGGPGLAPTVVGEGTFSDVPTDISVEINTKSGLPAGSDWGDFLYTFVLVSGRDMGFGELVDPETGKKTEIPISYEIPENFIPDEPGDELSDVPVIRVTVTDVPEPYTLALLGGGLLAFGLSHRRLKRTRKA